MCERSSGLFWVESEVKLADISVAGGFAPWRVRPHIDSTSDQVLKIYLSLTEKKRQHINISHTMKQNHTKHVYFSYFNPLKVTSELEIHVESLGWVHGGEQGGANSSWGETGIIRYIRNTRTFPADRKEVFTSSSCCDVIRCSQNT